MKDERAALYTDFRQERRDFLGTSEQNSTDQVARDEFSGIIPTEVLTGLNQSIIFSYREYRKQILQGVRTLPNYKKGLPVPFAVSPNKDLRILVMR